LIMGLGFEFIILVLILGFGSSLWVYDFGFWTFILGFDCWSFDVVWEFLDTIHSSINLNTFNCYHHYLCCNYYNPNSSKRNNRRNNINEMQDYVHQPRCSLSHYVFHPSIHLCLSTTSPIHLAAAATTTTTTNDIFLW